MVSLWSASTPERGHPANYPHVVPQVSALPTDQDRTPKAGFARSNRARGTSRVSSRRTRFSGEAAGPLSPGFDGQTRPTQSLESMPGEFDAAHVRCG